MTFPAERFASFADHAAWCGRHADSLADRRHAETSPPRAGTCVPCLRPVRFVDGACDCAERLSLIDRALLHAAVAEAGLCGWSRLFVSGAPHKLAGRLAALSGGLADEGSADVAVIDARTAKPALIRARRALVAGGVLLAAMNFDPDTRRGAPGRPGWEVLDAARAAGFTRAEVLRPWSRELGYLGPIFILKATA